jgi:hypothetical protein
MIRLPTFPPQQDLEPPVPIADPARAKAIAGAPESTVRNGFVVNHRREAVQREITARPPTEAELGVRLPPGARPLHEVTARQRHSTPPSTVAGAGSRHILARSMPDAPRFSPGISRSDRSARTP